MKKIFFFVFVVVFLQKFNAQQSFNLNPTWEIGKIYQLQSESYGYQTKENNRKIHEFADSNLIELKLISKNTDKNIFSWKIKQSISKNPNHIRMVEEPSYFDGIEFIFTTDANNKYIELKNLHEIKRKVQEKLSKEVIKEFSKNSKDRAWTQTYLENIHKDPTYKIAMIERQMMDYFKFYGVELSSQDIEIRRTLNPIQNQPKPDFPYKNTIQISQNNDTKLLNIVSNLDPTKFTEKDWENANFLKNQNISKLKKNFNITFQERYVFNNQDRAEEILILYTENNLHRDAKLFTFSQTSIKLLQ